MGTKDKIFKKIKEWEDKGYESGIPDEAPSELENEGLVMSYRYICINLLRNSNNLEKLGIPRKKSDIYNEIKRDEIYNREFNGKQLRLWK